MYRIVHRMHFALSSVFLASQEIARSYRIRTATWCVVPAYVGDCSAMTCVHTSPWLDSHISRVLAAALADIERARHVGLIVAICPMCSHQMFSSRRHLDVSVYLGDVHVDQWCTVSAEGDLGRLPTQWASPVRVHLARSRRRNELLTCIFHPA